MAFIEEQQQQAEQHKQLFLQRLNQLFDDIKMWVEEEDLHVEQQEIEIIEKVLGTHRVPSLSIYTEEQQKLVDIIPVYAFSIVAEGLIDIKGEEGKEYIVYLRPGEQTFYDIYAENWYWIKSMTHNTVYKINKDILFLLIASVSDYQF
ncbi:hypothetical protein [Candidatus Parabeggiatoa sp. HSG14]|uniref:hypothetical protein n=1 Tax=Candidatus Parabeggiatoa sp. HSG14 TaxID=3055593 RepID=UPI0025A8FA4B|nr:hypothetical protein [Thiotrichales bacterium HSG14]